MYSSAYRSAMTETSATFLQNTKSLGARASISSRYHFHLHVLDWLDAAMFALRNVLLSAAFSTAAKLPQFDTAVAVTTPARSSVSTTTKKIPVFYTDIEVLASSRITTTSSSSAKARPVFFTDVNLLSSSRTTTTTSVSAKAKPVFFTDVDALSSSGILTASAKLSSMLLTLSQASVTTAKSQTISPYISSPSDQASSSDPVTDVSTPLQTTTSLHAYPSGSTDTVSIFDLPLSTTSETYVSPFTISVSSSYSFFGTPTISVALTSYTSRAMQQVSSTLLTLSTNSSSHIVTASSSAAITTVHLSTTSFTSPENTSTSTSRTSSSASSTTSSFTEVTPSILASNVLYSNPRCLHDTSSSRTLDSSTYYQGSSSNSVEACALFCFQNGFSLAGTEYSNECYCANYLSTDQSSTDCNMACSGNSTEICGGPDALTVVDVNPSYHTLDAEAANGYQGCFVDGNLRNATFRSSSMTVQICNNYCIGIGYDYAGLEYGTNCFCGAMGSVPEDLSPASNCYATCYGNSSESCGGNGVMAIYKNTPNETFAQPIVDAGKTSTSASDIFAAVSVDAPSDNFPQSQHRIVPLSIQGPQPIHTNKQYSQAFYGTQQQILTMLPYIVNWVGDGFAVQHSDAGQSIVSGTATNGIGASSYGGPIGQRQITFSAVELLSGSAYNLSADSSLHASVNLELYLEENPGSAIKMPLVNGMGLVTAQYTNLQPVLQSPTVGISSFSLVPAPSGVAQKLRFQLGDSSVWVVYLIPDEGSSSELIFTQNSTDTNSLYASSSWSGTMQTAKIPTASDPVDGEAILDLAAGTWVTSMTLSGSTSGNVGTYSFDYKRAGDTTKSPLVFALPHHMEIVVSSGSTGILMHTPVTGTAHGYLTDSLVMRETELPTDIGFITTNVNASWTPKTLLAIRKSITPDILSGAADNCNQYSTYSSGKCLAKWGQLCMIAQDIVQDPELTENCIEQFTNVFDLFKTNKQNNPLNYETTWRGLVATVGLTDIGADFGATDYNDHHFHYGYVIYAAAVLGYLNPGWLDAESVSWVNTLVRDVANPSENDQYFPQFRNMDWYIGHGVAHGIQDDEASGKDQESPSEDYNFSYGLKLWGHVTQNANLEGLGNVMCSVLSRSLNNYVLLGPENANIPYEYSINYANGVSYANSMGYFTYFGAQVEYVNGIHMIPLTPMSRYIRTTDFVRGEFDTLLESLFPGILSTGWAGIIYSNLALSDPQASWDFFNVGDIVNFNFYNLDDGQSLSWALTFAAGLGGGQ